MSRKIIVDKETFLALAAFHEAWVETEVAMATGAPGLAKSKRAALIAKHQAVRALDKAKEKVPSIND